MNWHYLAGQEEVCYAVSSSAGLPSALWNLMPTVAASCLPASATAACPASRYGTMCVPSKGSPGGDTSMSSAEAFPVKTSLLLAREQVFLAVAQAYGQSSPVSLGKYDPATHSLRTSQLLLLGDSTECLRTLPRWGWMHAGAVSGLTMSERPISANDSGYWLPTPSAVSYGSNQGGASGRVGKVRHSLESMARGQQWPTPNASNWKSGKASQKTHDKNSRPLREQVGGSLNPDWVEWLMGWPFLWTCLESTDKKYYNIWYETSTTNEAMRVLRDNNYSQKMEKWQAGCDMENQTVLYSGLLWQVNPEGQHYSEHSQTKGSKALSSKSMQSVRIDSESTAASQRQQSIQQSERQYSHCLPIMPHQNAQSRQDMGERPCPASPMHHLQHNIPADTNPPQQNLRQGMQERVGERISDETMEQSLERINVVLGSSWATEPADVPHVATGVPHRVDRLRALGNGWLPQCAALAWRILTS